MSCVTPLGENSKFAPRFLQTSLPVPFPFALYPFVIINDRHEYRCIASLISPPSKLLNLGTPNTLSELHTGLTAKIHAK